MEKMLKITLSALVLSFLIGMWSAMFSWKVGIIVAGLGVMVSLSLLLLAFVVSLLTGYFDGK